MLSMRHANGNLDKFRVRMFRRSALCTVRSEQWDCRRRVRDSECLGGLPAGV